MFGDTGTFCGGETPPPLPHTHSTLCLGRLVVVSLSRWRCHQLGGRARTSGVSRVSSPRYELLAATGSGEVELKSAPALGEVMVFHA